MIFIKHNEGKVKYRHYMPFHKKHGLGETREDLELEGVLVDSIPEPLNQEGKQAALYVNPTTKEVYYKYEEIPQSQETLQQEEINQLKLENVELMMKSATTDMEIETVKNENAEMMFRLANLEMGGIL